MVVELQREIAEQERIKEITFMTGLWAVGGLWEYARAGAVGL